MYYVSILQCTDNLYYVGSTSDVEARVIFEFILRVFCRGFSHRHLLVAAYPLSIRFFAPPPQREIIGDVGHAGFLPVQRLPRVNTSVHPVVVAAIFGTVDARALSAGG